MNTRTAPSSKARTLSSARGSASDHSKRYEKPVQPPPRMPTRRPFGVVARAPAAFLISATALSVTAMAIFRSVLPRYLLDVFLGVPVSVRRIHLRALRLVVGDGALDRVLGENRAVDLHRRQVQLLDDLRVLDRHRLV